MAVQKQLRSVGRPIKGSSKRVRVSFTLAPEKVSWLKSHALLTKQSNSETIEAALSYYQHLCDSESSPLKNLAARYPAIFWDVDPKDLDDTKHSDFVIERVLEHGSLASLRDLFLIFTSARIAEVVKSSRRISRKTARFWAIRFGISKGIKCLEKESPNQLSELWQH